MSTSLFRSKQHTSKKNLKKLTISAPLCSPSGVSPSSYTSSPQTPSTPANYGSNNHAFPVIVLVAKYKFVAESSHELSIEPKNYMKLIERPGNGWLKVQLLDRYDMIGLIPASYVDIQVNDLLNPISLKWLNEYRDTITDLDTQQEQQEAERKKDAEDLFDFENIPTLIVFDQVLQNASRRYWYKIRITFSNKNTMFIGKTYEDFYNLHVAINRSHPTADLPKLPMPLRSSSSPTHSNTSIDKKFFQDLQDRRKNLESYFNQLLENKDLQRSSEVFNFMDVSRRVMFTEAELKNDETQTESKQRGASVTGISDTLSDGLSLTKHEEIAHQIFPDSLEISRLLNSSRHFSPTAPLPPPLSKSTSSTNLLSRKNDSNVKYSTYINQGDQSQDVKRLVNSNSSNTLMSYTSIIDVYDDDDETEEDSTKDDSFNHHSKDNSMDTKASSISDAKLEKEAILPEKHNSLATVASSSTSAAMTPNAASKLNHYSTNSSTSEQDSIFSQKLTTGEPPTTPHAPGLPFSQAEDYSLNMPTTPTTPIIEDAEFEGDISPTNCHGRARGEDKSQERTPNSQDYIKIKISLNNKEDDIVALRIKRTNLISIAYLKKLLSFKIYKDYNLTNHYKLQVIEKTSHEGQDMSDDELLEYLKANSKVNLRLARVRV